MTQDRTTTIVTTAINALPGILALLKANHAQQHPGEPEPTDADMLRGLEEAATATIAKDEAWKASHPVEPHEPNGNGTTGE